MPIDTHAHYVPPELIAAIRDDADALGVRLLEVAGAKTPALEFEYGFKVRPFFPQLVESADARIAWLDSRDIDRQLVATWPDIYGYGLPAAKCRAWHRVLNDTLAAWCAAHGERFSFVASVPMPAADDAAAELSRAADLGAVAVMVAANVENANLGEVALDPLWRKAEALGMPVIIHPVLVAPAPRAAKFGLTQIAQYTYDTTMGVGSLLFTGVLDRFPRLTIMLSHGGGAYPYLAGRFDIMHARMDRAAMGDVAARPPSQYAPMMVYDTIVHAPKALRFLVDLVGIDQVVLGTDYSFPPADLDPMATVRAAGFSPAEVKAIADGNARRIFARMRG